MFEEGIFVLWNVKIWNLIPKSSENSFPQSVSVIMLK